MLNLKQTIELLNSQDWYVGDYHIDMAKGLREAPRSWREIKPFLKRNKKYR